MRNKILSTIKAAYLKHPFQIYCLTNDEKQIYAIKDLTTKQVLFTVYQKFFSVIVSNNCVYEKNFTWNTEYSESGSWKEIK